MYSFETKVRYSELNSDEIVRPEAIVNYLQDCVTFHSNSVGATVEFYRTENKAWVLNSWQIEIREQIKQDEELIIGTWPYDFAGAYGYRNFIIRDKDGKNLVEANTLWVLADTETGRPVKLSEKYTGFYKVEEKLPMEYMDRKIKLPENVQGRDKEPVTIRKAFIDTNGHVNNGRYVECAADYIPEGYKVKRIRAEYKRQAKYGETFYPVVYDNRGEAGNGILCISLNDENGKPYALVEFDIYM